MEVPPRTQKVNWDVAIDSPNRRIGIDIIVRDHEGCVIVARSTTNFVIVEPVTAEVWLLCSRWGLIRIWGCSRPFWRVMRSK
jgi:hypothetical protein